MPDLSSTLIEDLANRLQRYLHTTRGECEIAFLASGGSAAVYKVTRETRSTAIKVYDPKFFSEDRSAAERRRLDLQTLLIGHDCQSLVQVIGVIEFDGTALVEMEFVGWPSLKHVMHQLPDDKIESLLSQLVKAVMFLDRSGIVHRDIKPENIHISENFENLKLLDLGVIREMQSKNEEATAATDHGAVRPFISTAQYSSPEYLFRLDPPSPELWKGLSIYQLGAVLHDMIMKRPLFGDIVELGNRWLLARAVLEDVPSLDDGHPGKLLHFKSVASKALVKDPQLRLKLLDWEDFGAMPIETPSVRLKMRISKARSNTARCECGEQDPHLALERKSMVEGLRNKVRAELIQVIEGVFPIKAPYDECRDPHRFYFCITLALGQSIHLGVSVRWGGIHQERSATILLAACMVLDTAETIDFLESLESLERLDIGIEVGVVHCRGGNLESLSLDLVDKISLILEHALNLNELGLPTCSPYNIDVGSLVAHHAI